MGWSRRFKKLKEFLKKEDKGDIEFFNSTSESEDVPKKKSFWNKWKKKNNIVPDITEKKVNPKNSNRNIFMNFRRRNTLQIIKYLESKEIFNCFFYTDVNNISLILEQGIRPTSLVKLLTKQEYIVWTYLEHATYIELELGNSTRHYFWKWCTDNKVDLNKIAIISIDINKLFQVTSKDWGLNLETNRVQVYEIIPVNAIDWILLKDKKMFRLAKMYVEKQNLKLKIYQGNDNQTGG